MQWNHVQPDPERVEFGIPDLRSDKKLKKKKVV
jgi:hypothetical protein